MEGVQLIRPDHPVVDPDVVDPAVEEHDGPDVVLECAWRAQSPRWSGSFGAQVAHFATIRGDQGHYAGRWPMVCVPAPIVRNASRYKILPEVETELTCSAPSTLRRWSAPS